MPKYAYFNAAANPSPVLGWIDTDAGHWPKLPSREYLVEVTDAQWAARDSQAWQVRDRRLEAAPSISLAKALDAKIAELNAAYQLAVAQPVSYLGTTFDADEWSQTTLTKVLTSLVSAGATPVGFYWVDASNNKVSMTLLQLQGLAGVMLTQGWTVFQTLQDRKTQARAAVTVAAVQAITW